MAVKKITMRPEGTGDYADELYPKTTASQVVEETDKKFMTDAERTKLAGIATGAQVNTVTSVAGKTGVVTLAKADVGLGSVENYGIATQAEAEAGTSDVKYMTPLKTNQAITLNSVKTVVTAGQYIAFVHTSRLTLTANGWTLLYTTRLGVTGSIRVMLSTIRESTSDYGSVQVGRNGVRVGVPLTSTSSGNVTGTQDIDGWNQGDTFEIWVSKTNVGVGYFGCNYFRVGISTPPMFPFGYVSGSSTAVVPTNQELI